MSGWPRPGADLTWTAGSAAPLAAAAIAAALAEADAPRLAVPGGRTMAAVFGELLRLPAASRPDFARIELFFADERAVPRDHPDSNYRLAREKLIVPGGISESRVHRMRGEAPDLDRAAAEYETLLSEPLDVIVLGLGEDGHVASLFPGSPLLADRTRRVAAVTDSPKPPARRLTLLPRAFGEARRVIVIAEGEGKRAALIRALAEAGTASETPARVIARARWIAGDMGARPE